MALGDLYADTADLKDRLGIDDDADMVRLTGAVEAASRGIERFCGRQFNDAETATARIFNARDRRLTKVDDFSTIVGLVIKTDEDGDGVFETTWAASDYQLEPLNGVVDGSPGWPFCKIRAIYRWFPSAQRANVQVTARWGWATVPTNVREACLISAEEIFKLRDTPFGVGGYGDFGVIKVRDNPFTARMLNAYRRDAIFMK